jgi:endonuclease III
VLGIAFEVASGIVVDTHVARVSERLGLVKPNAKPEAIEKRLCELSPQERWIGISHRLILHGRHVCQASNPDCARCAINELCKSRQTAPNDDWRTRAEAEARLFAVRGDRAAAGWEPGEIRRSDAPPIPSEPPPKPAARRAVVEDEEDF